MAEKSEDMQTEVGIGESVLDTAHLAETELGDTLKQVKEVDSLKDEKGPLSLVKGESKIDLDKDVSEIERGQKETEDSSNESDKCVHMTDTEKVENKITNFDNGTEENTTNTIGNTNDETNSHTTITSENTLTQETSTSNINTNATLVHGDKDSNRLSLDVDNQDQSGKESHDQITLSNDLTREGTMDLTTSIPEPNKSSTGTSDSAPSPKRPKLEEQNPQVEEKKVEDDTKSITESVEHPGYDPRWDNDFSRVPKHVTGAYAAFNIEKENFVKGCKWSPDGTCVATNAEDHCLRIFNLPTELCSLQLENIPEMPVALKLVEGELIYDYCWLPSMSSANPESCGILSSSRDAPVHMWDAYTGELKASYRAYDHLDELNAAYSLACSPDGKKLYCGFNKMIRVFDIERPGRFCSNRPTFVKVGQSGIISCIDVNPANPKMYAAGSYARSIALYYEPDGVMDCMFQGQAGGVTQVKFSPDGTKLYSGGRKDSEILCWDMRNPGSVLFTLQRDVTTNLRMYFDIDSTGQYVVSGNDSGLVCVWDTLNPPVNQPDSDPLIQPHMMFPAHGDCANGVSLHPSMPVMATACGQRHFRLFPTGDSDDSGNSSGDDEEKSAESSLKLWWIGKQVG